MAASACLFLCGCIFSTETLQPSIEATALAATQYNHRGMVMNEEDVAQAQLQVQVPTRWSTPENNAQVGFRVWANMDLSNDTGDEAWLPDGHSGEFTEIDLEVKYSHVLGPLVTTVGATSYILPNGLEFITDSPAFAERGETKEAFLFLEARPWRIKPFVQAHFDYDEADGEYVRLGARAGAQLAEKIRAELSLATGYSDENHAAWTYGEAPGFDDGFVDARLVLSVAYQYDPATSIFLTLGGSTIVDDDQEAWFDALGIESDNVWVALGMSWSVGVE